MKNRIHDYIQEHKKELVDTLKELIKIPSVRGELKENAPFGAECARVLEFTQKLYEKYGFDTELDAAGGYLLAYYGEGKNSLGLFAHADVVPVNDDWLLTSPFEPLEKDGFIIGRGALDDKSAIVISLYCAKMLKELNIPFNSRLVLFTGSNEESGMEDIESYVKNCTPPDFSLVCDTGFPLYRGNKGVLRFVATQNKAMKGITDFHGGAAFNITLGEAVAKIEELEFSEKGVSEHAALPEGSLNAAHVLAKKLSDSDLLCEDDKKQMALIAGILEKYYGEIFGIENNDKDFGKLTVANGIVGMENSKISLSFDMRYGMSVSIDDAKQKIRDFFESRDWTAIFVTEKHPFLIPENNPCVVSCLNTYKTFTGDANAKTYINAGGTYARALPSAVEIGTSLNGKIPPFSLPNGHGHVHQPDEYISIEGLLNATELTALMLLSCDKELNK